MNDPENPIDTVEVLREILKEAKEISGTTWALFSDRISQVDCGGTHISEDLLRQYVAKKKRVGPQRLHYLADAVSKAGWAGPTAKTVLDWHQLFSPETYQMSRLDWDELKSNMSLLSFDSSKAKRAAIRLNSAIKQMREVKWQELEIIYMAIAMLQKLKDEDEDEDEDESLEESGLISPHELPFSRKADLDHSFVWLSWEICDWLDPKVAKQLSEDLPKNNQFSEQKKNQKKSSQED